MILQETAGKCKIRRIFAGRGIEAIVPKWKHRMKPLRRLSCIYWDYEVDSERYLEILEVRRAAEGWHSADRIPVRILESLRRYRPFCGRKELARRITEEVRSPFAITTEAICVRSTHSN